MHLYKHTRAFVRIVLHALLLSMLLWGSAYARVIDSVDVNKGTDSADIVIHFGQRILYLRHVPVDGGRLLRVFLRLSDTSTPENELPQESLSIPRTAGVPNATIVFPELVHAMLIEFSQATQFKVRPGDDGQSIIITVPLLPGAAKAVPAPAPAASAAKAEPEAAPSAPKPAAPPQAATPAAPAEGAPAPQPPAPPALSNAEVEAQAKTFMAQARTAMAAKDGPTAVNRLYRVLGLAANSQTEPAQALIGEAREMNGEVAKARAEYDLYLKLFPGGPNAARVRKRLAALPAETPPARRSMARALPEEAGPAQWSFFGSISAYYYTGHSQIETLVPPPPGQLTFDQQTLSFTDQNSLITSINFNGRRHDGFTDTRIVLRDTDNQNFLTPSRSYNRLYSAYVDHVDRKRGYNFRAGRQNPNGAGVLERFDGVTAGYLLNPNWRVNAVYGDAVEFASPFKKIFYGASVERLPDTGRPGASAYYIEQTLDGFLNRRAFGTEVRYFDGHLSAYGTLDYDVLYRGVNIALIQGNYLDDAGNNYYLVLDHRRAPSFALTSALFGAPGVSIEDLVANLGLDQLRRDAVALTAISNNFSVGFTHPYSDRWQFGIDYRLASISSTQAAVVVLPLTVVGPVCAGIPDGLGNCVITTSPQAGTGNNHVVTFQAIGSNLFVPSAIGVGNLSLIEAPTYHGQAMNLNYVLPFRDRWRLDTNLRYYTQNNDTGDTQDRFSPSCRLAYRWGDSTYLEAEVGGEESRSSGPTRSDHITRRYFFIGLRKDFH